MATAVRVSLSALWAILNMRLRSRISAASRWISNKPALSGGLPLQFSGNNLVKSIRAGAAKDNQSIRLVVDLTQNGKTRAVKQQSGAGYNVVFTIDADVPSPPPPPKAVVQRNDTPVFTSRPAQPSTPARNPFKADNDRITSVTSSNTVTRPAVQTRAVSGDKVVIAIDAGHGGQDPGAIGAGGTQEKNVTISIARKLRALLNDDPMFKPVMTRDGDYFISVMGRSDVARKQNANFGFYPCGRCAESRCNRCLGMGTVKPPCKQ